MVEPNNEAEAEAEADPEKESTVQEAQGKEEASPVTTEVSDMESFFSGVMTTTPAKKEVSEMEAFFASMAATTSKPQDDGLLSVDESTIAAGPPEERKSGGMEDFFSSL